jgi:hypothetical protein
MKREDLRAIEGMTDAQVDAVMALAGRDSTAAHAREEALQQQLTAAQQGLAAFGTQKPADLAAALQQVQQLQTQLNEQAADYRFRDFARNAAQDAGAIDAEDVINLLAQDAALKGSSNLDADIRAAVDKLKVQTKPHWFKQTPDDSQGEGQARKVVVPKPNNTKTAPGTDPTVADFAMMNYMARMELKAKNPTLFADLCAKNRAAARQIF